MFGTKAFRTFASAALLLLLASVATGATGGTRRRNQSLTKQQKNQVPQQQQQQHHRSSRTVRGVSWSNNSADTITSASTTSVRRIRSGTMRSCKMFKKDESCAPSQSPVPSDSPSRSPSASPTASPSASPSVSPTVSSQPSQSPSSSPSSSPTISASPSSSPTSSPSASPTPNPTNSPTRSPTPNPTNSPTRSPTKQPTRNPTTNSPTFSPLTPAPTTTMTTTSDIFDSSASKQCSAGQPNQKLNELTFTYEYRPCSTSNNKYTCTENNSNEACDLSHQVVKIICFPLYATTTTDSNSNASPIFVGFVPDLEDFTLNFQRDLNDNVDTVQQLKCEIHTTKLPTTQSVCQEIVFDITGSNVQDFVTGNQYGSLQLEDCELSGGDSTSPPTDTTSPPATTLPDETAPPTTSPVPTTQSPTTSIPTAGTPSWNPTISQGPSQAPTTSPEPSQTPQPSVSAAPTLSPTVSSSPSNSPSVSSPPTETPPFDTDRDAVTGEFFSECKNTPTTNTSNQNDSSGSSSTNDDNPKIQVLFQFRATVTDPQTDDTNDDTIGTILEKVEDRAHILMARRFLDCVFQNRGSTRRMLQRMKEYRLLDNDDDEEHDLDVTSISSSPKAQTSQSEFCPPSSSESSLQRESQQTTSCHVVNDGITFTARNGTNLSNDTIQTAFGNLLRKAMGPTGSLQRVHPQIKSLEFVGITSIGPVDDGQGGGGGNGNIGGINQDPDPVKSGNDTNLVMPLAIAGAAVVLIVGFALYRRNRQNHQDDLKNQTFESLGDDNFSDEMNVPVMSDEDNSQPHMTMGSRYGASARSVTSDCYIESDQHMMDTGSVWGEYTVNSVADSQGNAQGMEIRPRDHPFDEVSGRGGVRGSYQDGPSVASQQLAEEVVRSMRLNRSTSSRGQRSYSAPDTVIL